MSSRIANSIIPALASVVVLGSGFLIYEGSQEPTAQAGPAIAPHETRSTSSRPADAALALNEAFVGLAERVMPAVVRIEVTKHGRAFAEPVPQLDLPDPFRRFFELPDPGNQPREPMLQLGGGTGFIVSSDGYIVTNDHVAGDADRITVWLSDQHSYEATLVGRDPTTDVAVVRIDAEGLPALDWGSSDDLRVGEWVMAVGNPGLGGSGPLDHTATTGIVSAKDRPLRLIGESLARDPTFGETLAGYAIENFIQTDAVINPGNSGGPMVNLEGEVVGINTAIASTTGYYQGYGFAVPSDLARRVVEDLIEDGKVERAWLGVSITAVTAEDADVYGLPGVYGALVQDVTEGSPAADAGLRPEDVIVAVDGEPVHRGGNLQQQVAERRPEQQVTLTVYRDGKPRGIEVELGEAPINDVATSPARRTTRAAALDRLGMEVQDLTPETARRLGYEDATGVIVSDLEPLGPAARRGVSRGLEVLEINGSEVSTARDLEEALAEVEAGSIVTLVMADPEGRTRIVNVRTR